MPFARPYNLANLDIFAPIATETLEIDADEAWTTKEGAMPKLQEAQKQAGRTMMIWQLSEAKNRLSEVLNRVSSEGPQQISRRDERFVVISLDEYRELKGVKPTFKDWLFSAPDMSDLDLERDQSPGRDVEW